MFVQEFVSIDVVERKKAVVASCNSCFFIVHYNGIELLFFNCQLILTVIAMMTDIQVLMQNVLAYCFFVPLFKYLSILSLTL